MTCRHPLFLTFVCHTFQYAAEAAQVEAIAACDPALATFVLEAKTGGNVEAAVGIIMDSQGSTGLQEEMEQWQAAAAAGGVDDGATDPMAGHHEPDEPYPDVVRHAPAATQPYART